MSFHLIDLQTWERREFFEHFINAAKCTYSTTVNIDITNLKGQRIYPTMIWLLTQTVNQMPEFHTAFTDDGLGIYDEMHPAYTIFNKEKKNFSGIWTVFNADYNAFFKSYKADIDAFSSSTKK